MKTTTVKEPIPRTRFFKSCLGVFQGGGCRGAALAGAYSAALECGINFSQVAGASAGAIVAALIGANASPEYLLKTVSGIDFPRFLVPPVEDNSTALKLGLAGWVAGTLGGQRLASATRIAKYGGLYSSEAIEHWIEDRLGELLPDCGHPLRFEHLTRPTFIVATDLLTSSVKVWNTFDTPKDSVAFAVRASCSIPFFFQPVEQGATRLVDGGVLSNLPAFVFLKQAERPLSDRILAFRLEGEHEDSTPWSVKKIAEKTVDAVVDGAIDVQRHLQPDVHVVSIPTPGVHATDFEVMDQAKVDQLISTGKERLHDFIRNEAINLQSVPLIRTLSFDQDQVFGVVVERAEDVASNVLIADRNAEWIWKLFPTVLYWKLSGICVRVLVEPVNGPTERSRKYEVARRSLLRNLGVVLHEVPSLPLRGYFLDATDDTRANAIIYLNRTNDYLPIACYYGGAHNVDVVKLAYDKLSDLADFAVTDDRKPDLAPYNESALRRDLKERVPQYQKAEITTEPVSIGDQSYLSVRYAREYKYRQIERMIQIYETLGFKLFAPISVRMAKFSSIITPPVVEVVGNKFVVIEGNTRFTYARLNHISELQCIVVRNVQEELPTKPIAIKYGAVVARAVRPDQKMSGLDYNRFRRIEDAVHPVV